MLNMYHISFYIINLLRKCKIGFFVGEMFNFAYPQLHLSQKNGILFALGTFKENSGALSSLLYSGLLLK